MTQANGLLQRLLEEFRPGQAIYVPGATGQLNGLFETFQDDPDRAAGVEFVGCFVPGMNEVDYAGLHPTSSATTFMLPRAMRASFEAGRVNLVPASYAGAASLLAQREYDVVIAHVAAPDQDGACSLGVASDFTPLVWARARRRVLLINPLMPAMRRGPRLALSDADVVVEAACPLVVSSPPEPSATLGAIARRVASLIPDNAAIQTGIGGAPSAIWPHLQAHRRLSIRSGMANDGVRDLAECGALASDGHRVGIAYGSESFYRYLAETDLVGFATTVETHGQAALAGIERFHAVNSALEVDLLGQVNLEWQWGRLSSGVGGAIDFARAAAASPGGRSIIALPATAMRGVVSRIVTRIGAPAPSLCRSDVDTVVTEFGVAEVRGLGLDARAQAIIEVAAPEFRERLREDWARLRAGF